MGKKKVVKKNKKKPLYRTKMINKMKELLSNKDFLEDVGYLTEEMLPEQPSKYYEIIDKYGLDHNWINFIDHLVLFGRSVFEDNLSLDEDRSWGVLSAGSHATIDIIPVFSEDSSEKKKHDCHSIVKERRVKRECFLGFDIQIRGEITPTDIIKSDIWDKYRAIYKEITGMDIEKTRWRENKNIETDAGIEGFEKKRGKTDHAVYEKVYGDAPSALSDSEVSKMTKDSERLMRVAEEKNKKARKRAMGRVKNRRYVIKKRKQK